MKLESNVQYALLNIIKDNAFNHQELWCVKIENNVVPIYGTTYFKSKGAAKTAITNMLNSWILSIDQKGDTPLEKRNPDLATIANAGIRMKNYLDSDVPKKVVKSLFDAKVIEIVQFLKCD